MSSRQQEIQWARIAPQLAWPADGFPHAAVKEVVDNWESIGANLLAELTRTVFKPGQVIAEESMLPVFAMFLAAQARDTRVQPLLLALARLPQDQIEALIDDSLTNGLQRCLASTHPGDDQPLKRLAEDESVVLWSRLAAVEALVIRVVEGDADRDEVADYVLLLATRTLQSREPGEDMEIAFTSLVALLCDLGVTRHWPAIEAWHAAGLIDPKYDSIEGLRGVMFAASDAERHHLKFFHYVRDAAEEMAWWATFTEPATGGPDGGGLFNRYGEPWQAPVEYEGTKIGRNEPCPCGSGKKYKKCCGSD